MAAHAAAVDYYAVLQVNRDATDAEIRTAYKQRATALHPDKNGDPSATKDFQRLVEAYTVLKDPVQRKIYDVRGTVDSEDFYSDDEDYEDDDDEPVYCNCGQHHHRGPSFADIFERHFNNHFRQYGYGGFFWDEDDYDGDGRSRNFWRKFSKGNSRFGASRPCVLLGHLPALISC